MNDKDKEIAELKADLLKAIEQKMLVVKELAELRKENEGLMRRASIKPIEHIINDYGEEHGAERNAVIDEVLGKIEQRLNNECKICGNIQRGEYSCKGWRGYLKYKDVIYMGACGNQNVEDIADLFEEIEQMRDKEER